MENKQKNNSKMCKIQGGFLFLFSAVFAALLVFLIKSDADKSAQKKTNEEGLAENSQKEDILTVQQAISQDRELLLRDLNTASKEQQEIETTVTTTTTTPEPVVTEVEAPKADSKTKSS